MFLNKATLFIFISGTLFLSSCGSFMDPHEVFQLHMGANVGKHLGDPGLSWMDEDGFVRTIILPNGNHEKEYIYRGTCRYYFEIDPDSGLIISWRFEGKKDDCKINP